MDLLSIYSNYLVAEKRYSPHTSLAYITDIREFKGNLFRAYQIEDLRSASHLHIRSWMAELSSKNIQARSIRRKISSLKNFYKFLRKRGLVQLNPLSKLVTPKIKKRLPLVVRENELAEHIISSDHLAGEYEDLLPEMVVAVLYTLGLRRSELINLKLKDINLKTNQLKVSGKGGKDRIIPFGHELNKLLKRFILIRENLKIEDENFLFLLPNGKKFYPKGIYLIVNKWLSNYTSLSKRSPHILRHSFATHLADHGADINSIKKLLGHSNLSATEIYTHTSMEQLKWSYLQAHPRAAMKRVADN